ncbi:MAG: N-acetyltransferase [Alphaproteobacteria bacterium]|nr:MAG: N-acetyltransferase [Alphaproteobacteria bacterium]
MRYETIVDQPVIAARRFDLRPLRRSDAGLIGLYAGDARVAEMTTDIPHPLPPGAAEAYVQRAMAPDRDADVWAIDGTRSGLGELLGLIWLRPMDRGQSEIGFWVAPAFWNSGIASEAIDALLRANPQGCRTVFASVFQDNPVSARVLTNLGFEYLGEAEAHSVARGANVPTWTYMRRMNGADDGSGQGGAG